MIAFRASHGVWSYCCSAQRHLLRHKDSVDRYVVGQVKARAAATAFPVLAWDDDEAQEIRGQVADLGRRKHEALTALVDGSIAPADLKTLLGGFDARIGELEDRLIGHAASRHEVDSAVLDLSGFDQMGLEEQRAAIGMWVDRITIQPAARRGPKFDPALVQIQWKDMTRTGLIGSVERP